MPKVRYCPYRFREGGGDRCWALSWTAVVAMRMIRMVQIVA
jgi:hypothetical protein